jgi:hypothetical protein
MNYKVSRTWWVRVHLPSPGCYSGWSSATHSRTTGCSLSKQSDHVINTVGVSRPGGPWADEWNVAACPSPDGSARGRARRGEVRWPDMGEREVEILRPSCSSRAQVGCACSRGLQASTQERERAASRERLSRPRPRAANLLVREPWSFLL